MGYSTGAEQTSMGLFRCSNMRGVGEYAPGGMERHTVRDAADILGITTGAVRNRLSRRTLQSVKEHGTVYVLLPRRDTERDTGGIPGESTSLIVSELRAHNATLREQLEAEREANRENRRIIAALTARIPELPPAASQEPSEAPSEATEQPGRVGPQAPLEGAQEPSDALGGPGSGTARGSWWRRMFGG
jgi:hypothetical protein